jgi:hypothetical protein
MVPAMSGAGPGMALDYHISPDEGLITINGDGTARADDIARLGQSLLGDRNYDPSLPQLLDFRGLRPAAGKLDELRAFVLGPYRDRVSASVAVVIDEYLEHRHGADIFLLTCAIHQAELFCNYDQALKWLMRRAFATQPARALLAEQEDAGGDDTHRAPE